MPEVCSHRQFDFEIMKRCLHKYKVYSTLWVFSPGVAGRKKRHNVSQGANTEANFDSNFALPKYMRICMCCVRVWVNLDWWEPGGGLSLLLCFSWTLPTKMQRNGFDLMLQLQPRFMIISTSVCVQSSPTYTVVYQRGLSTSPTDTMLEAIDKINFE